ncbi:thioredoxin-related transmembrane protein 1 isoform X1 [Lepisosteus oculatus]|uniref:Thioredoxin-related transmembrane protein 1 n=2 Tax=Lepisosteus oculatus TaxID=7918 RepID=W5N262_LEPOC|nr:PREDICTED: thioredoxin-related transmembrane protein 1 isoform X1 [Lepisosteus oculatus]
MNMATSLTCRRSTDRACSKGFIAAALLLIISLAPQAALCKKSHLRVVTDGNWQEILEGEWMIEFFAPWCPACQQLQPVWNEFAEWAEDMGVNIAKVDVTEEPGLSGRFIITALPTIYHCKDGVFRRYQGARTKDDFLSFVDEKKWQDIEPVSSWFGPSSFLMNTMSALFKLSMFIRHCHNYITEQIGIPVWGSYAIFALATLFSGLVLGLILVFIADCVFPSRRFAPPGHYQKKQALEQARLIKRLEDEQEADGEEEDEDECEEERGREVWRKNHHGGHQEVEDWEGQSQEDLLPRRERLEAEEESSHEALRRRMPAAQEEDT